MTTKTTEQGREAADPINRIVAHAFLQRAFTKIGADKPAPVLCGPWVTGPTQHTALCNAVEELLATHAAALATVEAERDALRGKLDSALDSYLRDLRTALADRDRMVAELEQVLASSDIRRAHDRARRALAGEPAKVREPEGPKFGPRRYAKACFARPSTECLDPLRCCAVGKCLDAGEGDEELPQAGPGTPTTEPSGPIGEAGAERLHWPKDCPLARHLHPDNRGFTDLCDWCVGCGSKNELRILRAVFRRLTPTSETAKETK